MPQISLRVLGKVTGQKARFSGLSKGPHEASGFALQGTAGVWAEKRNALVKVILEG